MVAYYNNKKYNYVSTCQYCGQKVIRWGSHNGSKVVLNPKDLGMEGPHKYTCTGNNPYSPQWINKLNKFLEENSKEEYNNKMFI